MNTENLEMFTDVKMPIQPYNFFNLTPDARNEAMQAQFEVIQKRLLADLNLDSFNEFYSPEQSIQYVCGRVVNLATDEPKLKEHSIGLFNGNNPADKCRLKLNVLQVPHIQLFEGEVVAAQGQMDNKKFNVNRIIKPRVNMTSE